MKLNLVSTTSTESNNAIGEAFRRNTISVDRKLEVQEKIQHPDEVSPVAKTLLNDKETPAIKKAKLPQISKEIIINRELIDPAPEEWNFFGRPNPESYNLLMNSIIVEGLMNPITLWKRPNGRYMILSGHTRDAVYDELYQASGDRKWLQIPAKYYDVDDLDENYARRIIILANIAQRAKETPRLRIRCYAEYAKLTKERAAYGSGIDVNEVVGEIFGVHRTTVFFYRRLNNLIDPLLDQFCNGEITSSTAKILSGLPASLQKYLVKEQYLSTMSSSQIQSLKKAESTDDIDAIFLTEPKQVPTHRYSVTLSVEKTKDADIFGLCIPKEHKDKCREAIRKAFNKVDLPEETRSYLLKQLD